MDANSVSSGEAATKTLTAVLIPADQELPLRRLDLENPDYRTYQDLVGGLFECLDIPHGASLFSNDEAKLIGLEPNYRATSLLYLLRPEFINTDFLAGDVVVLGQPDEEGDTTSAPEIYVQLLTGSVSVDITCAWDGEPWDVYGLRHDGRGYLTDEQAAQLDVAADFTAAQAGDQEAQRRVSQRVYERVLSGKGCPNNDCGFDHGQDEGPYRETQYRELIIDGVTDDDPQQFL